MTDIIPGSSNGIDLGQQFVQAETANEILESSAPYQRALLRILAICERDNIAPAPLVSGLAVELPAKYRDRVEQLSDQLNQGVEAAKAIDSIPELLPPSVVLALRLAREKGTLPALNAALLARLPENETDSIGQEENNWSQAAFLLCIVFVAIYLLAYLMIKVVPEFKYMLEEFGVEVPATLQLLIAICDYLIKFWFLAVLPLIFLLPFAFAAFRRYLKRWNPLIWRQRIDSPEVRRRRALALITQTGIPAESGIEMILGSQPLHRRFRRLNQANEKIQKGQGEWESLAAAKVISDRDAEALATSDNPETQAWLLRWSASVRQNREATQAFVITRLIIGVVNIALGILVFLACAGVFMTLISIMTSLQ